MRKRGGSGVTPARGDSAAIDSAWRENRRKRNKAHAGYRTRREREAFVRGWEYGHRDGVFLFEHCIWVGPKGGK